MSSVASLIRLKLIERAKRIDGSAPFHYDVGDRVRGAQAFVEQMADQLDAGNLPAIWVFRARDGGQRQTVPNTTLSTRTVRWTALLIAKSDGDLGQEVEDAIEDLERAFEDPSDTHLIDGAGDPILAAPLRVEQSGYAADIEISGHVMAAVDIVTTYPAVYGDPAAKP